jgi:NADP-dependent 3-hydroxy acid dehydrogenase YdfG
MSRVILVTGASTGLGAAICHYLSGKGYTVYGTSRNIQQGAQPFNTLQMDVGNEASIHQAITAIVQKESRIDVLINNAGLSIAGVTEHLSLTDLIPTYLA